jgi:hypothetical protein
MNSSGRHGGAQWRSVVSRCRIGTFLVATGAVLSIAALVAGPVTTGGTTNPLSLRVLGVPPLVPVIAPDPPLSSSSPPVAVTIPAMGVTSILEGLRIDRDGSLQAPRDPTTVGWYADGPAPGDQGAAVLVGHLDSKTGPAVFWRLAGLVPGDRILVRRADGRTLTFVVDHSTVFVRTSFPTATVFSASGAELHLITCNGNWDRRVGRYDHSLVVFARLADMGNPAGPQSSRSARGNGTQ